MAAACPPSGNKNQRAFTLVEVLVGSAVLVLLLVMLFSMTSQTTSIVSMASARVDAFQTARTAFDTISQRISQTTMNTYWDYYNTNNQRRDPTATNGSTAPSSFVPATYGRASDLHFLVQQNSHFGHSLFFAAPQGISGDITKDQTAGLLNAIGYSVQYGSDAAYLPSVVGKPRFRYRLMQAVQPTENFQVYTSGTTSTWVGTSSSTGVQASFWPLADNVIALIVWPRQPVEQDTNGTNLTTNYLYDSRSLTNTVAGSFPLQYAQAPPAVQITMVTIDEASAQRLDTGTSTEPVVISNALAGSPFVASKVGTYQTDIANLEAALARAHINYLTLTTTVNLKESKWSSP